MATKLADKGPISLRRDDTSDPDLEASSGASNVDAASSDDESTNSTTDTESHGGTGSSQDETESEDGGESDENEDEEPNEGLKDVSFGTLAEAQERYAPPSRKRKLPGEFGEGNDDSKREGPVREDKRKEYERPPKIQRQSKHAPTIVSSKQQVSRRRDVFEPSPAIKSRDPRFDPTIMSSNYSKNAVDKANKNYGFLTSYQAAEVLDLKAQIKKSKDPDAVAELKRKVMSIESKVRSAERQQRESKILSEHNQKERAAIRSGEKAKPYFLKPGELKKKAEEERVAGMGKRARDKAEQRKKKREKSKEARYMPRVRREG